MSLLDRFRRREPEMAGERWLIVGLGNPGDKYAGSRHNIGHDTVRRLAERLEASFKPHKKAQALIADCWSAPGGTPLSLVLPFGYYNTSGGPVQQAMTFYKVPHERLVVAHDEIDLEFGKLRLKRGGGTAGNKGLRDIQQRTSSPDFFRVRIGVGRPPGRMAAADYVLQRFSARERDDVDVTSERAADAILDVVTSGLEAAQNRHH